MSQPGLSRQFQALERDIGVPLVNASPDRSASPRPVGRCCRLHAPRLPVRSGRPTRHEGSPPSTPESCTSPRSTPTASGSECGVFGGAPGQFSEHLGGDNAFVVSRDRHLRSSGASPLSRTLSLANPLAASGPDLLFPGPPVRGALQTVTAIVWSPFPACGHASWPVPQERNAGLGRALGACLLCSEQPCRRRAGGEPARDGGGDVGEH